MKLHHITKLLAMLAGSYLIWSFILWNANPAEWRMCERFLFLFSVLVAELINVLFSHLGKPNTP